MNCGKKLNGLSNAKDIIKFSDPQIHRPERVPGTKNLLSSVGSANMDKRQNYKKKREENEKRMKKLSLVA